MKVFKIITLVFFSLLLVSSAIAQNKDDDALAAEEAEVKKEASFGFGWNIGYGISIGFPNIPTDNSRRSVEMSYLSTTRIDIPIDIRYRFSTWFSLGVETGLSLFYNPLSISDNYILLDIPLRGFVKFGSEKFNAQIFGGYYFCITTPMGLKNYLDENGAEVGLRVNLSAIYIQSSYIFSSSPHFRVGIGHMMTRVIDN